MNIKRLLLIAKKDISGLPWWRSGWESTCQCRGHGFEPWSGKIPHAAEQLGLWATTTEPARLEPVLRDKRGRNSERPAHHNEEWSPLAATRESPRTETKTQHSQKLINKLINFKKRHLKLMILVLFYVEEDARVLAHWSYSLAMHLNYLGPVSCFSPTWIPLRVHPLGLGWGGGMAAVADALTAGNIHCLLKR